MPKLSWLTVRRSLESIPAEELIDEVRELYEGLPEVREYYQAKLSPKGQAELLTKYKRAVKREFSPSRGIGQGRVGAVRRVVEQFARLSANPADTADIMIWYVELGVRYTMAYGDIDEPFYASMENMYDAAIRFSVEHRLAERFQPRFKKIVDDTRDIGWGFHDFLDEAYREHFKTPLS